MKSALALCSLSLLCGSAHNFYQEALETFLTIPAIPMSRFAARSSAMPHLLDVVRFAAKKHGVEPTLVKSIIKAESAFNEAAVSPKGALGLMQLMPETATEYGAVDPLDPEQNIDAGTKYLGALLRRYQNHKNALPLAIAAYNAGPGNVDKYKGIPPFSETRTYVSRVLNYQRQFEGLPQITERPVFAAKSSRRLVRAGLSRRGTNG